MHTRSLVAAALTLLSVSFPALPSAGAQQPAPNEPPAFAHAEAGVSPDRIRETDRFISSDLFEGRYPGLRGGELAAEYIADQFAQAGLYPAGDHGGYLQEVNFVGMRADPAETSFSITYETPAQGGPSTDAARKPLSLQFGQDFVVSNQTLTPTAVFNAPIVFVGYGVTAPEFGWNDFAGVDVKGKVILCIVGDPPSDDPKFFGGRALSDYCRWRYKF